MKRAVIQTGGKQYLVKEGEELLVELLNTEAKTAQFEPLLLLDDGKIEIGTPTLSSIKVQAEVLEADIKAEKVTSIRYKAKKRVHKVKGHRQHQTKLKIKKIG